MASAFAGSGRSRPGSSRTFVLLVLFSSLGLLHLFAGTGKVLRKERCVRIIVLFSKRACFLVKRCREIEPTTALISFGETVVDVRRIWIALNVTFECGYGFLGLSCLQVLVTNLIDHAFGNRNDVA